MKKSRFAILISFLIGFSSIFYAQDTIVFNRKYDYHYAIRYAFNLSVGGLNESIRAKIKQTFERCDFSGPEYECQYHFSYGIALDSCGNILECYEDKFEDENLMKFSNECKSIILKSNWKISNSIVSADSSYFFKGFVCTFTISCEPSEITFDETPNYFEINNLVYAVKEDNNVIYFDGFKIGCEEGDMKKRRNRKKCKRS